MKIATYHTRTGIIALEITESDGSYSYTGKHGAGCGPLEQVKQVLKSILKYHKGIKLVDGTNLLEMQ